MNVNFHFFIWFAIPSGAMGKCWMLNLQWSPISWGFWKLSCQWFNHFGGYGFSTRPGSSVSTLLWLTRRLSSESLIMKEPPWSLVYSLIEWKCPKIFLECFRCDVYMVSTFFLLSLPPYRVPDRRIEFRWEIKIYFHTNDGGILNLMSLPYERKRDTIIFHQSPHNPQFFHPYSHTQTRWYSITLFLPFIAVLSFLYPPSYPFRLWGNPNQFDPRRIIRPPQ